MAEAAQGSASTSPGSVIALSSGGLTINLIFDAAAMAAPASFRAGIQQAAALLSAAISDKITINLKIDYSGTGGGAAAGPDHGQWVSYSNVRSYLVNNATAGDGTFDALPGSSTLQGQSDVAVWNSQLKLWGLLGANDTSTDDGSATFATDIAPSLLVGVALHELTHAMGRVPYGTQPDVFDFFRFTGAGTRLFLNGGTAPAAYFSLDGGNTKLADYGQSSDASDFLNSGAQDANDPFNEFYTGSTFQQLTTVDLKQLVALGYHLVSATPVVIESFGATSLVQIGSGYFVNPVSGGTGPELKLGGAAIGAGQLGPWVPIGAEATASGYKVVWKVAGADEYTAWNFDASGNFVSSAIGYVSGTSAALESLEPILHQDLNGDGTIGLVGTTIEAFGATSLVQVGTGYDLNPASGGPELKLGGAAIAAGQLGPWVPIGAEATSSGYEVVWKVAGADEYTAWNFDASGNFVSSAIGYVSGTSAALESLEPILHQDLNGDGTIGLVGTTIEAFGATSLVQVGTGYDLNPASGGPELKLGGAAIGAGQLGPWVPIGAEATASGYEVVWKVAGADEYTAWNFDASGNFVSSAIGYVSGTSAALESLEPILHQDLNGDGTIGLVGTTIEAFGATSLVQVGTGYDLNPASGGPELKLGGAAIAAGQLGPWVPIGAEATSSGYEVVWKVAGADEYTAWNFDASGNFVSSAIGYVSGTSAALESLEPILHQDLNGDGTIGLVGTTIEAFGATSLVQVGTGYDLNPASGGPELKLGGAAIAAGQLGPWVPIAAEATASGYEVVWKVPGADQFTAWDFDTSGNFVSSAIGYVSGASATLESLEPMFHQDLNDDGTIGMPSGTTQLSSQPAMSIAEYRYVSMPSEQGFLFREDENAAALATVSSTQGPTGAITDFGANKIFVFGPESIAVGASLSSEGPSAGVVGILAAINSSAPTDLAAIDPLHDANALHSHNSPQAFVHSDGFHLV